MGAPAAQASAIYGAVLSPCIEEMHRQAQEGPRKPLFRTAPRQPFWGASVVAGMGQYW